jgi:hypothetical protein
MSQEIDVRRAARNDLTAIAHFYNRRRPAAPPQDERTILLSFVETGYLLAERQSTICGLLAWRAENLIARVIDVCLAESTPHEDASATADRLLATLHEQANELHCEVVFLAGVEQAQSLLAAARAAGYEELGDDALPPAWKEAANELRSHADALWFKRLNEHRVRRPL